MGSIMKGLTLFLSSLLVGSSSLTATYGQDQEQPVFRAGALTVVVDVVVVDAKNRVVFDLKSGDFVIDEDGVEQRIDTFELHRPAPGGAATRPPLIDSPSDPRLSQPDILLPGYQKSRQNLIIFLLDYATTEFENQKLVREASMKYVNENLQPDDYVAVFGLGARFRLLAAFTNDKEKLISALQSWDASGKALAGAGGAGPGLSASGAAQLASSGTIEVSADSPQGFAAAGQEAAAEGSAMAQLMLAERIQNMFYNMSSFVRKREARSVMTAIQAIARGVEEIEGRKTLILFSQGFVVGPHMDYELEKTVNAANKANLAIYGIDTQGLAVRGTSSELLPEGELQSISSATGPRRKDATGGESLFDRARQVGSDLRDSTLRHVSTATGGFAIRHTNDLHLGMQRIDQDIRSYYLISYRPANQKFDGEFRKIRVEVKRSGLVVRHRSGYLAVPPGMEMVTGEEFRLLQAAQAGRLTLDLPAYFRTGTFFTREIQQDVLVTLEVPSDAIQFRRAEEDDQVRYTARLEIIGLIRDGQGRVLQRFGTPVNLHATQGEYEILKEGSISFNNRLGLVPGIYSFQIFVQDRFTGRAMVSEQSIRVPRPGAELALSTIVLGKEVEPSEEGNTFLTAGGTTILPSAQRRFRNGEKLIFFFDVYNVQVDLEGKSAHLNVKISLMKSGSQRGISLPEYIISETGQNSADSLSVAKYIELAGLEPGTYFLMAEVTDQVSNTTKQARTPFYVVESDTPNR